MQLKNNLTRNRQFYFMRKEGKKGEERLVQDFIHVPGGATVEIDDNIFEQICSVPTQVQVYQQVETKLDEEAIGADIKSGKNHLVVKELVATGQTKTVNLVREAIKSGELTIVQGVERSIEEMKIDLQRLQIDPSKMDEAQIKALHTKLV